MYIVVSIAILATMVLALTRALMGPSVYDRVLAANVFGTKTVMLLSVTAFLYGRPDFLDLALAYALVNMVGILAVLEFFQKRSRRKAELEDD
ncbi:MAG: monovalent cation/H+ antiporter complex subunit F [Aliiglaciecola sp.]|uniref:monovalent cation/H+ antiporter complex subunit F n=1 Tax=Aliiglaciecola sp. M165 TaxID=2593649 RepID=UPI0021B0F3D6|nr:monovalent cation/H+ antiporter complex subunit F [Aliiglaciecola sp. M165]